MSISSGIEVLRDDAYRPLHGLRVGLLTNPSAIDHHLETTLKILLQAEQVRLTALFAPEHGLYGAAPDGEKIPPSVDLCSGLPVYSLYGDHLRPTPEMFEAMDAVVCDIQDIGIRYYTFTWTISYLLDAVGECGIQVFILDRPNPLGGLRIDGPLLEPEFSTLVGRYPVPVVHGMTLGELLWMVNERWNPHPAQLTVIPCRNLNRATTWDQTGLPWAIPSPNMPHLSTLQHYAGACLIEGTNLSEGRGTTLPFEIVGAPWIDPYHLANTLNRQAWADRFGVRFRPHSFQPTASKFAGQVCYGVQAYIIQPAKWQPIHAWLEVISAIRASYPEEFAWLPPYTPNGLYHFDRLIGTAQVREGIEQGEALDALTASWKVQANEFASQRQPFLLYPQTR